jgi:hypothetical protein
MPARRQQHEERRTTKAPSLARRPVRFSAKAAGLIQQRIDLDRGWP